MYKIYNKKPKVREIKPDFRLTMQYQFKINYPNNR